MSLLFIHENERWNNASIRICFMSLTSLFTLIWNVAAHMELRFVSPPPLVVDPSDAWFLCRSADSKRLMIIHTVYDIGVAHGKDRPDTPVLLMGLTYTSILPVLSTSFSRIPARMDLQILLFGSRLTASATTRCSVVSITQSLSTCRYAIARLLMAH
jgi:hypothetical protein